MSRWCSNRCQIHCAGRPNQRWSVIKWSILPAHPAGDYRPLPRHCAERSLWPRLGDPRKAAASEAASSIVASATSLPRSVQAFLLFPSRKTARTGCLESRRVRPMTLPIWPLIPVIAYTNQCAFCPAAMRKSSLACSTPETGRFAGSSNPTCTSNEAWSHQICSCATFPFSNFITTTCGRSTCLPVGGIPGSR